MQKARCDFTLEEDRGNTDVDGAERRSVQLQREAYVIDSGGTIYQSKLLAKAGRRDRAKIRPRGNLLPHQLGVGVKQRFAARVNHGGVVNEGPKRDGGLEIVQEVCI